MGSRGLIMRTRMGTWYHAQVIPCRLHGGMDIIATSLEEAYERKYANNNNALRKEKTSY